MYGKFTGIDFSGKSIRICTVQSGFRDQKIEKYFSVATGDTDDQGLLNLRDALMESGYQPGSISTNIPSRPLTTRVVKFPFSDPKKIDKVYGFELENVSTFDPDEKLHSYHLVRLENGSEIIVCMYEKDQMGEFLKRLEKTEVDPSFVTFSPLAFSALDSRLPGKRPLLLVDTSNGETNFSLFDENGLKRVRASSAVDEQLLQILQSGNNSVSVEDCKDRLGNFVSELKKTAHFFESELRHRIELFVLSGDICKIENLEGYLSGELDREVRNIYISELGKNDSPFYARAFSLALYGGRSGGGHPLNLRTGDFEYAGKSEELRQVFLVPGILLLIFVSLVFYKTASDYYELEGRVNDLRAQIRSEVTRVFPNAGNVPDPVRFMEDELGKVEEKLQLIEEVKGGSTPLDVLRDLSLSIPDDIDLKLDEVRFETGKQMKVWARCDSYKEIAALEETLANSGRFENVSREQVNRAVNNTIKFVLALVLK